MFRLTKKITSLSSINAVDLTQSSKKYDHLSKFLTSKMTQETESELLQIHFKQQKKKT